MRKSMKFLAAFAVLAAILAGCVRDQQAPRTRIDGVDKKPEPQEPQK